MDDDGWEARMAARTRERRRTAVPNPEELAAAHRRAGMFTFLGDEDDERRRAAEQRRWAAKVNREHFATRTLGDATERLRGPAWACACNGEPLCCATTRAYDEHMRRAAQIVVKQIADLAAQRS